MCLIKSKTKRKRDTTPDGGEVFDDGDSRQIKKIALEKGVPCDPLGLDEPPAKCAEESVGDLDFNMRKRVDFAVSPLRAHKP